MWWRILGVFFAGIAAAQTYANHLSLAEVLHQVNSLDEILIVAVPYVVFWIAVAVSVAVAVLPQRPGIATGLLRGVFVGMSLFLLLLLLEWNLWPKPFSIITDGIGYWAYISIPSFWLGLPMIIMGALVGAKLGGAALSNLLIAAIAVPVLWMPVTMLGGYAWHRLWQLLERGFIAIFS